MLQHAAAAVSLMHHLYGQRQLASHRRGERRTGAGAVEHRIKRIPSYSPQPDRVRLHHLEGHHQEDGPDHHQHQPAATDRKRRAANCLVSRSLDHVYRYYLHSRQRLPLEKFDPREADGEIVMVNDAEERAEEEEEKE